ncbi:unnamed protein product [Thelazia callipaeda]|uniref:Reverse transcriptase domain-containing protein n=1 Tax=Thelazia callipaeda TaxID=103827 RepID=A0A0N5D8U9_THECL|nr:unnamed protein product [Thelazia callipaeda]
MIMIEVIIRRIEVTQSSWPGEVLKAVLNVSGGYREGDDHCVVPCIAGSLCARLCLQELKKKANAAIIRNAGRPYDNQLGTVRKVEGAKEQALEPGGLQRAWKSVIHHAIRYVRTAIRIKADRPDILVHDKKRREVILIEIGITGHDSALENARKHLIRSAQWIRRGRSSEDQHSRTERGASAARMPEYVPSPESMMQKRGITSV